MACPSGSGSAHGRIDDMSVRGRITVRARPAGTGAATALVTMVPPRRRPSTKPSAASRAYASVTVKREIPS